MYVKDYRELPVESSGVDGLTVRWAINASQGATNFAMRVFELAPGKSSSLHQHDNEHEIFVLSGNGEVATVENVYPISEGSVIYIAPNEGHQFQNNGTDVLRFVDMVMFSILMPK